MEIDAPVPDTKQISMSLLNQLHSFAIYLLIVTVRCDIFNRYYNSKGQETNTEGMHSEFRLFIVLKFCRYYFIL